MTLSCFQALATCLSTGAAVLATVTQVKGSTPRELGAKLIVTDRGLAFGTIGGGDGEAKVLQQAAVVLQTGVSQRVTIDLSGAINATARDTQGICGGTMQIWLAYWAGTDLQLAETIATRLQAGQSVTIVTPQQPDRSPYLATAAIATAPNAFVETLLPAPTLLIVGAGHVGIQLAKVAHSIGFQIVVQDDRPDWATAENYPQADRICHAPIAEVVASLAAPQLYAALVTRGYPQDVAALKALLDRDPKCHYLGMIGSRRRVQQVLQSMSVADPSQLYAPIGLDIGALTPEEIAVSIAAELILVRRGGTGRSLSALDG